MSRALHPLRVGDFADAPQALTGVSSLDCRGLRAPAFSESRDPILRCDECGGSLQRMFASVQHRCTSCNAISNRVLPRGVTDRLREVAPA